METIECLDRKKCTGCSLCAQICPKNAIILEKDKEGFSMPKINKEKCINCGLCYKKCPQLYEEELKDKKVKKAYAAKNKDVDIQKKSTSGGIFNLIAENIISKKGIVYGCAFDHNMVANHIRIESNEELDILRGSKYVQSNINNTYKMAKEDLKKGKPVLYTGTPCQIEGLKKYIDTNDENLITIDLVCHGVPSPKLFEKYIKYIEKKENSKVVNYEFRNKEKNGWGSNVKIEFENGKKRYIKGSLDSYNKTFYAAKAFRESCYNCKYAKKERVGDITLCDYWGIGNELPEFEDYNGVSGIIVNTIKGQDILEEISNKILLKESSVESIAKYNQNLNEPVSRPRERDNIYKEIDKKDYKRYMKENLKFKIDIKDVIGSVLNYKLKKRIKKVLKGIKK